jgi:hypothetical protein
MDNSTRNGGFSGHDRDLGVDYGGRFKIFLPWPLVALDLISIKGPGGVWGWPAWD